MYKHNRRRLKSTDGFKRVCDKDKLICFRSYIGPPFICLGGGIHPPPFLWVLYRVTNTKYIEGRIRTLEVCMVQVAV